MSIVKIDRVAVLQYRMAIQHLTKPHVPQNTMAIAARCGFQDSAPLSAVLSLHARVDGIGRDAWRDDTLAQVFGPRGAIYVVPRIDIGIFTLGLLPRDSSRVGELEQLSTLIHETLDGNPMRQSELVAALPDPFGTREMRWVAALGTLLPVWDTVDTVVHAAPSPAVDPESARCELALRFFRYLGPRTVADLRWWLGGTPGDAETTVRAIRDRLTAVSVDGQDAFITTSTIEDLSDPPGHDDRIRLLPPDDPYVNRLTAHLLVPEAGKRRLLWPQAPPPGAMLIGLEVAGTWRRRGGLVTVHPWSQLNSGRRSQIETAIGDLPVGPAGETPRAVFESR